MKKYILVLLLLFSSSFFMFSNAQLLKGELEYSDGNSLSSFYANSIVQTKDNGYTVAGYFYVFPISVMQPINRYICILNLDSMGNFKWNENIGGSGNDVAFSIVQTQDEGYAVTGLTTYPSAGKEDVYVAKLDSAGNIQWGIRIGGLADEQGNSIIQTMDGGYAITGSTSSFGLSSTDVYVIKLDSTGTTQWTRTLGGAGTNVGYSIIQSKDGGYAITGYTTSYGAGGEDVYVVKLDSAGNLQWTKTIGGTGNDAGQSIIQSTDGSYVITGYTNSYGAGSWDVYIIKLDLSGNLRWTKTIGGASYDQGFSIIQTKDGGYTLTGLTGSFSTSEQVYVVRLDSAGNLQWTQTIGGTMSNQNGSSIVQTKDGGYAIGGTNGISMYMLKFDSTGNTCNTTGSGGIVTSFDSGRINSGGSITSIDSGRIGSGAGGGHLTGSLNVICSVTGVGNVTLPLNEMKIYPNPCTNNLNIAFENPSNLSSIQIMDITGRVLLTYDLPLNTYHYPIDVSSLSSGMYFIRINSGSGTEVRKFIKE